MFYYSKNSRKKIVHKQQCPYCARMKKDNTGLFLSLDEARAAGYRLCIYCSAVGKRYLSEYKTLASYAVENGLSFRYDDGKVLIETPHSSWMIITNGKKHKMFLYHQNAENFPNERSLIPGYHSQHFQSNTILGYMEYIVEHDGYRLHHKYHMKNKPEPSPPRKGTKRYKKLQRKIKRDKRRAEQRNVYRIFEELESERTDSN